MERPLCRHVHQAPRPAGSRRCEEPPESRRKLLLPPDVVVAADPFVVAAGEPRAWQALSPRPGRSPEARLQRAGREVVPDPRDPSRTGDPAGDDTGAEGSHPGEQVRAPLS